MIEDKQNLEKNTGTLENMSKKCFGKPQTHARKI